MEPVAGSGSDDLVLRTAVTLAATASLAWGVADLLAGVWTRRVPVRVVLAYSKVAGFVAVALLAASSAIRRGRWPRRAGPPAPRSCRVVPTWRTAPG